MHLSVSAVISDHQNSPYFVYILRCGDGTLYTGITRNVEKRLAEHNDSPKGAKYTRSRRPLTLVYREPCRDKSCALKREKAIKKMTRPQKEAFLESSKQI